MALPSFRLSSSKFNLLLRRTTSPIPSLFFSSSTSPATPYPLQYELIASHPSPSPLSSSTSRRRKSQPPHNPTSDSLTPTSDQSQEMDKSKRKYYLKRRKRMYGSDDDDDRPPDDKYVELKPEVVDLPTLHAREEELYFYDALSYPWEKDKHYRMVYQLEKKYFPDHCLDKAFEEEVPAKANKSSGTEEKKIKKKKKGEKDDDGVVDQKMLFFEEESGVREAGSSKKVDVSEKKVEELFKCLKKVPSVGDVSTAEPFISARKTGLPPRWDGPSGTVVLVNKPKGQILSLYAMLALVLLIPFI